MRPFVRIALPPGLAFRLVQAVFLLGGGMALALGAMSAAHAQSGSYAENAPQKRHWEVRNALLHWRPAEVEGGLQQLQQAQPSHPLTLWLASYHALLQAAWLKSISYPAFFFRHNRWLGIAERHPPQTPLAYVCHGDLHIHRARVYAARGEWWSSAWALREAVKLLENGLERYPGDRLLRKSLLPLKLSLRLAPPRHHGLMRLFGLPPAPLEDTASLDTLVQAARQRWAGFFAPEAALLRLYTLSLLEVPSAQMRPYLAGRRPGDPAAADTTFRLLRYWKAYFALKHRALGRARALLEAPLKAWKGLPPAWLLLGQARLLAGAHLPAREALQRYLASAPPEADRCPAYRYRAWSAAARHDTDQGRRWREVVRHCDGSSDAHRQARLEARHYAGLSPAWWRARFRLDAGRPAQAVARLEEAGSALPDGLPGLVHHYLYGKAYQRLDRPQAAVRAYRRALAFARGLAWADYHVAAAWVGLGQSLWRLQRPEEAREAFEKSLEAEDYPFEEGWQRRARRALEALEESSP
jgi:tetratricopeptide (TPR) repeat protein